MGRVEEVEEGAGGVDWLGSGGGGHWLVGGRIVQGVSGEW